MLIGIGHVYDGFCLYLSRNVSQYVEIGDTLCDFLHYAPPWGKADLHYLRIVKIKDIKTVN